MVGDKVGQEVVEVVSGDNRILNILYLRCLRDIEIKVTVWCSDKKLRQAINLDNNKSTTTTTVI